MALIIPYKKCLILQHENFSLSSEKAAGYQPGPVAPSGADPAKLYICCTSYNTKSL